MIDSFPVARALSTTCCISQGERNWPFLMLTGRPAAATATDEIGLPAQEGRRLQHVHDARHFLDRRVFVDVGEHRHLKLLAHLGEDLQPGFEARAAEALAGGTVGLVEGGLEHVRHAERAR